MSAMRFFQKVFLCGIKPHNEFCSFPGESLLAAKKVNFKFTLDIIGSRGVMNCDTRLWITWSLTAVKLQENSFEYIKKSIWVCYEQDASAIKKAFKNGGRDLYEDIESFYHTDRA